MWTKCKAWLSKEKKMYWVKSIDLEHEKVNLVGAETVDLSEVELLRCSSFLDNAIYPAQKEIFDGDILLNEGNGILFEVHYGVYSMWCPVDKTNYDNIGFYATSNYTDGEMPLGPTEKYATVIGNRYENPEILKEAGKEAGQEAGAYA